jgi:putative addiction module component (TIGR02574 family)
VGSIVGIKVKGKIMRNEMGSREILEKALKLKPEERFLLVEGLLKSLDEPDKTLDAIWAEEAERRLRAYREGRLEGIPMEDIFEAE